MGSVDALAQERRARLAAERALDQKQNELFAANAELSKHALTLTDEIIEKREEVAEVRVVADQLRGEKTQVLQDLEQAHEAVDIAERRLWDSVETVEDGFAVFDRNNCMVAANEAYLSVFDGLESMVTGVTYLDVLKFMAEEGIVDTDGQSRQEWRDELTARWQSPELTPKTIRLWNGQFIKLVDRRSENGDTVSMALNITDTIRREKQLEEARQKAEAANRAKSAFLAKMSHELRTPMNGVVGMADLLVETTLDEEQQLFVDTIKSSGEALLELINDVLDFSKMEAAKLVLHSEEFNLENLLADVLTLFQPAVMDRDIELVIDYDMFQPTRFVGDPGRVRQILTNLVGNAVKFTASGHVLVRVVGVPQADSNLVRLHITVEDTGPGIPENMIGHIFGEFNQVEDEKNRKFEGTGLGLAITKQLVELMQGDIWVDSEVGIGSNFGFRVSLPAVANSVMETPSMPDWVKRVVMLSSPSHSAEILSKQLAQLGVDVAERTPESFANGPALTTGDVLVADISRSQELEQKIEQVLQSQVASIPTIYLRNLRAGEAMQDSNSICYMNKPVGRQALVKRICAIEAPEVNGQAGENMQEPTAQKVPQVKTETDTRKMRILAAEDNRTNRLVFSKLVGKLNVDLEFAENGSEAVEKWQSFKPDLVFMDISMPVMDGKEATRKIRELEAEKGLLRTPVVALTAHAMDGDDAEILKAGLDHYLTKPLRKPAIFEQIEKAVPDGSEPVFDVVDAEV